MEKMAEISAREQLIFDIAKEGICSNTFITLVDELPVRMTRRLFSA